MTFPIFEKSNRKYLGFPVDMIIDNLKEAMDSEHSKLEKQLTGILSQVIRVQETNKTMLADIIEATVRKQIVDSEKSPSSWDDWMTVPVKISKKLHCYNYTTENLKDLNRKLQRQLNLKQVTAYLVTRNPGIINKSTYPGEKHLATIRIPKSFVNHLPETLDMSNLNEHDESNAVEPVNDMETREDVLPSNPLLTESLTAEESEISGVIMDVLDAGLHTGIIPVKSRVESILGKSIEMDVFYKIVESLAKANLVDHVGTELTKK